MVLILLRHLAICAHHHVLTQMLCRIQTAVSLKDHLRVMKTEGAEDFWFLDESASNINMTRRYGWAKTDERIYDDVPCNTPISTTVLAAFTADGRKVSVTFNGGTTKERFYNFLNDHLFPAMHPHEVLVMDNHRSHHARLVANLIQKKQAKVKFLPPYSPDFNPIEKMWSKMKTILRGLKPRDAKGLKVATQKALSRISASDCRGWFHSCGYVFKR